MEYSPGISAKHVDSLRFKTGFSRLPSSLMERIRSFAMSAGLATSNYAGFVKCHRHENVTNLDDVKR